MWANEFEKHWLRKKKILLLEGEVKILKSEKEGLENERNSMFNDKESLLKENKDIKESLEKLVEGKKKLEIILGTQTYFGDKQGVGFDLCNASSSKRVFIRSLNKKFI